MKLFPRISSLWTLSLLAMAMALFAAPSTAGPTASSGAPADAANGVSRTPPPPSDPVFFDGVETGNLCSWSATSPPTFCGECAAGETLVHESGALGIADPDTFEPPFVDWSEYHCEAAQSCEPSSCAAGQTCLEEGGRVACACSQGYAGAQCELCAVGYEKVDGACVLGGECRLRYCSGQGDCVDRGGEISCRCDAGASGEFCQDGGKVGGPLRAPTRIEVSGAERSVEQGEVVPLRALTFGDNVDTRLVWELVEGPGSLDPLRGPSVTYTAPAPDGTDALQTAVLYISALCCPGEYVPVVLTIVPPSGITISGTTKKELVPLDQAVVDFMLHRCIGAATLGVSFYGKVIHTRGFGNLSGAPSSDPDYLAECGDSFDVTDAVPGIILPAPAPVEPNTPLRIGSCTKPITAAIARRAIRDRLIELGNASPTDDDVEAALLTDATLDLLPFDLRQVMSGASPPPVPLATESGGTISCDTDKPCPYGGFCYQPQGGQATCVGCPTGKGGVDCSIDLESCPDLSSHADSRWAGVTAGDVLWHETGMPKSVPNINTVGYPNLDVLRGLASAVEWNLQEAVLTTDDGFPAGDFQDEFNAAPDMAFDNAKAEVGVSRFVPRFTDRDAILNRLGACLLFTPGDDNHYSNTGFAMLGLLAEHTTGQPFSGEDGKPGQHQGSLLEDFLTDELGVPLPGQRTQEGIFFSQNNLGRRSPAEPIYRAWNAGQGTYYPLSWDTKRPYCVPEGDGCSFATWMENASGNRVRFPWHFDWDAGENEPERTLTTLAGNEIDGSGGAGGLAAEPAVYLKFMSKFWVKRTSERSAIPSYGKTRCPDGNCIWNLYVRHDGARTGTKAWVMQLGPGSPPETTTYKIPPVDPKTGRILDDFANLETHECILPAGVDLFFAMNTSNDKKCAEANDYTCKSAYKRLSHFLLHGICQIAWPANPFVVWPQQWTTPAPAPVPFP